MSFRHEDGTVKFWSANSLSMNLIFELNSACYLADYIVPEASTEEQDWPPYRKVSLHVAQIVR